MSRAVLAGFVLGFLVGAQVGPIWLFCARTALRSGVPAALAVGFGAAVVDFLYACLGVAGAASLLRVTGLRVGLGLLGAGVLVLIGGRTFWAGLRVRAGAEGDEEVASPLAAFRTSLLATASNPLTIASWAAIFTAASTARFTTDAPTTAALLVAVGVGSMTWFALLSVGMHALGRRASDGALRSADVVAGLGMVGYGGLLGLRTLADS